MTDQSPGPTPDQPADQPASPAAPYQPSSSPPAVFGGPVSPASAIAEPPGALAQEEVQAAPAPKRRRGLMITAFVLAGLVILTLGAGVGYLWSVHAEYVSQNEALREEAATLGETLGVERAAAEGQALELAQVEEQLVQAKQSISDMVNDSAHDGDDVLALTDLVGSMIECANARQDLIDHLWEKERWTTSSLQANERSVTKYCNDVKKSFNEFKDNS